MRYLSHSQNNMATTKGLIAAVGVMQWLVLSRPIYGFNTCQSMLRLPRPGQHHTTFNDIVSTRTFTRSLSMITNKRRRAIGGGGGRSANGNKNGNSPSNSAPGGRDEAQELQATFATDAASSASSSSSPFRVVLEDESGHVNRELAERIWSWEQGKRRMQRNLPDDEILPSYSTRQGIRLVHAIVKDLLASKSSKVDDEEWDDLTQEGIIALMHAMTTYFDEFETVQAKSKHAHRKNLLQDHDAFERYAKGYITNQLRMALNRKAGVDDDDDDSGGRNTKARRSSKFLSMESTVGVSDPMEETHHYYTNLDEWEEISGHVLDTGKSRRRNMQNLGRRGSSNDETPLVEEYLDEMIQFEGEDEMWIHQQQVAAPLRDFIPETDEDDMDDDYGSSGGLFSLSTFDDQVLRDMIRFNVDEFLGTTLNETESKVIQLRFGLATDRDDDDSRPIRGRGVIDDQLASATASFSTSVSPSSSTPLTQHQVAQIMNLPILQVESIQQRALEKLRQAYSARYVDDEYDIIDDFHYWQEEESA